MGGTVTALRFQKRNKDRVNVFVDGEFAFAVDVMVAAELRKGQALSNEEMEELRRGGELDKAIERALRYLTVRPRSEQELDHYLAQKGYDEAVASEVLQRLREKGYLNDTAFAEFWVENRNRFRPRGKRALRYELRQKGIDDSLIEQVLEPEDEVQTAWSAAEQRIDRWRNLDREMFTQKMMGFLSRRGYAYQTCRQICDEAWERIENGE